MKIGLPDEECRRELLRRLTSKLRIDPQDFEFLIRKTDGYTGAQLEELVNTALLQAMDLDLGNVAPPSMTGEHLKHALQEVGREKNGTMGFA